MGNISFGVSYEAYRAISSGEHNIGNVVVSKDGQRLVKQNNHKTLTILNDNGAGDPVQNERARKMFMRAISAELGGVSVYDPKTVDEKGLWGKLNEFGAKLNGSKAVLEIAQGNQIADELSLEEIDRQRFPGMTDAERDALTNLDADDVDESVESAYLAFTEKCNTIKEQFLDGIRKRLLGTDDISHQKLSRENDIAKIINEVDKFKVLYTRLTSMRAVEVDDGILTALDVLIDRKNDTLAIENTGETAHLAWAFSHKDDDTDNLAQLMQGFSDVQMTREIDGGDNESTIVSVRHTFDSSKISQFAFKKYQHVSSLLLTRSKDASPSTQNVHERIRNGMNMSNTRYDRFIARHDKKLQLLLMQYMMEHDANPEETKKYVQKNGTLSKDEKLAEELANKLADFVQDLHNAEIGAQKKAQINKRMIETSHFFNGDWAGGRKPTEENLSEFKPDEIKFKLKRK